MELTPRQIKTLERFKRLATSKDMFDNQLALVDYLVELEEHVDDAVEKVKAFYPDLMEIVQSMKGDKGDDADNEYLLEELTKRLPKAEKVDNEAIARLVLAKIRIPKDGQDGQVDYDLAVSEVLKRLPEPAQPDTAEDIRNKLELLMGDDRLNREAIRGFDEFEEETNGRIDRALSILDQRTKYLINKATGGTITLTTTGTSGAATYNPNTGVLNIPQYGGGTFVREENVAASGSGTAFTLNHTPTANTLQLFRGGSRITVYGGDYSITGAAITLTSSLNTAAGETLSADYQY